MTRTNRLPGGDDKHNDRTRQPHHRASPTPRAGANINRKWPSMDTTDDIRQPRPMPRPRPPLRRTKVVSSRRKTTPGRRHHPIRRFEAFTRDDEGRARGDCEAAFKKGNDAGVPPASWPQRTAKGFPPIHPPRGSTIARSAPRANGEALGASHARRRSAECGQERRSPHLHQPPAEGGPTRSTSGRRHHARRNRVEQSTPSPTRRRQAPAPPPPPAAAPSRPPPAPRRRPLTPTRVGPSEQGKEAPPPHCRRG